MPNYRQNFSRIFAIFFVIALPFIIIYSFGFDLNLGDKQLNNTISINIETLPRGAAIINQGKKILETPTELKAKDNQVIPIEVALDGYKTEKFLIWAPTNQNTSARITRLSLLPNKSDDIAKFEDGNIVNFLSDNYLLIQKSKQFFIQAYSFTGTEGSPELIKNNSTESINIGNSNLWQLIGPESFWNPEDNIIINKSKQGWELTNLNNFPQKFNGIAKLEDNIFLALDSNHILWQINLTDLSFAYLESGVQSMASTQTPNNIWLRKNKSLIRLNRGIQDTSNFSLEGKTYTNFPNDLTFLKNNLPAWRQLSLQSVNQGLLVQVEKELYYIPDYKPDDWIKIATGADIFKTSGNSIFWIDQDKILQTYNLYLKEWGTITTLNYNDKPENINISYYPTWNRVLIYTPSKVLAIWFDKEIYNKEIIGYYSVDWITDASCNPNVLDRYQFCIKDNKLVNYKNLSLW